MRRNVSYLVCENAAKRLSEVINCASIAAYARTLNNPNDISVLSTMVLKIGVRQKCPYDDLIICTDYFNSLQADLYRPAIVHQTNNSCQQFYGKVSGSSFYGSDINPSNENAA